MGCTITNTYLYTSLYVQDGMQSFITPCHHAEHPVISIYLSNRSEEARLMREAMLPPGLSPENLSEQVTVWKQGHVRLLVVVHS